MPGDISDSINWTGQAQNGRITGFHVLFHMSTNPQCRQLPECSALHMLGTSGNGRPASRLAKGMVLWTEGAGNFGTNANSLNRPQPYKRSQLTCPSVLQVLGTFGNGRIEAWIHMRPLKPEEMCQAQFSSRIAQRLAQFHAVNVKEPREPELFKLILKWWGPAVDHQRVDNPGCLLVHVVVMEVPPLTARPAPHQCMPLLGLLGASSVYAVSLKPREPAC